MQERKTLLITGASSGIGAATARLAAARGYDLALGYFANAEGAEAVAREARGLGARAVTIAADLSRPSGVTALFEAFDAAYPRLDALLNNAGVVDEAARVEDFTPERLRRMVDVNLVGPILVAGQAVRRMSTRHGGKGGAIVNISSAAARLGSANLYVDYAATKAAIDILTKGLSDEVAAEGIRVAGIRPGLIDTPIHEKGGQPGRAQRLAPQVPMQRVGRPEEIAEAALWLLSDAASYVTGTTLDVSGGR